VVVSIEKAIARVPHFTKFVKSAEQCGDVIKICTTFKFGVASISSLLTYSVLFIPMDYDCLRDHFDIQRFMSGQGYMPIIDYVAKTVSSRFPDGFQPHADPSL
jgi:hypothetical protein